MGLLYWLNEILYVKITSLSISFPKYFIPESIEIYPKEILSQICKHFYTRMFTEKFIMAEEYNQNVH